MTTPAYGIGDSIGDGPQCSASGEFCFLCAFEADKGSDTDEYRQITDLIGDLVAQRRELPAIVRTVASVYDSSVRANIVYAHPDTGAKVVSPCWAESSVRRHLLFSHQFPELFDDTVVSILHSLIVRYNAKIIDTETELPIEETRKALSDTLLALEKWERHAERPRKRHRAE